MSVNEMKDEIENSVLRPMRQYITEDENGECGDGYTMSHVDKCGRILSGFLDDLEKTDGNKDKITHAAEKAVVLLNDLNENLDYALIETEEREALCGFILKAVNEAGLKTENDITEEWRDW